MSTSPDSIVATAILVTHIARSIERLFIVGIAGWSVWLSFSLARYNTEALKSGKIEIDPARWRIVVGSMVIPVAILPIAAACAFFALGLTPVETTWPATNSIVETQTSANNGQKVVIRHLGGAAAASTPITNPGDRWLLVGLVSAARQLKDPAITATEDEKSRADQVRRALNTTSLLLIGDVFGTEVQSLIQANHDARIAGKARDLNACESSDRTVCSAVSDAAEILEGKDQ